jgi:xylulokinase
MIASIDLGSTSIKVFVYDETGKCVASASRPTEKYNPFADKHPDWVFWNPDGIWGGACAAFRDVTSNIDASKIRGVAVTGMGMDGVPVDEKGKALYPFISWHCGRTAPQAKWWEENIGTDRTFSIAGLPPWAMTGVMRVRWMMEHHPEIIRDAHKWLLIEDYVNCRLCGVMATDTSMATCMLLLDQQSRQWSEELVQASEIPRGLLPDIKTSGAPLGEICAEAAQQTGLRQGTPVILGGHDHLCGTLPVGAHRPGIVSNVMGSWEILIATVARAVCDPTLGRSGICVQSHVAPQRYAVWGGAPSASALSWCRELTGDDKESWDDSFERCAADTQVGAGGVIFLPYLFAATCPVNDPTATGAFIGLRNTTRKIDLFRAVVEGLNYQFLHILQTMERSMQTRFERIVVSGGATQNTFWMQNKADISGFDVEVSDIQDTSPLGAALLAGVAVGVWPDIDTAVEQVKGDTKVFHPNPENHKRYQPLVEVYQELAATLHPAFVKLAAWRGV